MISRSTNTPRSTGPAQSIFFSEPFILFTDFSFRMAAKLIFLFFFLLPFHFSLGSIGKSDVLSIRIILPLIILLWAAQALKEKKLTLPAPLTFLALSTFLLWMLLSLTWADNSAWGARKAVFWLSFFPFFFLLTDAFKNKLFRTQTLRGLVWGGASIGLVGVVQFFSQFFIPLPVLADSIFRFLPFFLGINFGAAVAEYPSIFVNIGGMTFLRAFGFFPDPHIFAYYTGMVLPLSGYLALRKHALAIEKIFPFLLGLAVLLSFSRASYVALLAAAGVGGIILLMRYRTKFSVLTPLISITFLIAILISPITSRFQSSFSLQDGSVAERSRLWGEAVTNIQKEPLLGTGLGNYPLLVKPTAEAREPIYVHNLYLDIAVELGIMGLFLFGLFVYSCLPSLQSLTSGDHSYRLALFLSLLIFLVHSLFEYPLFSVHILPLFLTLLALLYAERK